MALPYWSTSENELGLRYVRWSSDNCSHFVQKTFSDISIHCLHFPAESLLMAALNIFGHILAADKHIKSITWSLDLWSTKKPLYHHFYANSLRLWWRKMFPKPKKDPTKFHLGLETTSWIRSRWNGRCQFWEIQSERGLGDYYHLPRSVRQRRGGLHLMAIQKDKEIWYRDEIEN